jgi:hypothetical protein
MFTVADPDLKEKKNKSKGSFNVASCIFDKDTYDRIRT